MVTGMAHFGITERVYFPLMWVCLSQGTPQNNNGPFGFPGGRRGAPDVLQSWVGSHFH